VAAWVHQDYYDLQNDDAYISYRYAVNWARGAGVVYNLGERVEGYTNFLLVAVLALAARAGADVVFVSRALGTLASWLLILLAYRCMTRELQRSGAIGFAAAAALALHAALVANARSGLETVPLAGVIFAAQLVFLSERRKGASHWGSGVLYGVASLLRADALLFIVPAVVCLSWAHRRGAARFLTSLVAACGGLFLAHVAWRWIYYGDPLPNTFYLRLGGDVFQQLRGVFYVYKNVEAFGGTFLMGLPAVLLLLRDPRRDFARLFLGLSVALHVLWVIVVGGDYMPMARFLVPVVPALTVLLFETILEIARRVAAGASLTPRHSRILTAALLGWTIVAGFVPTVDRRRAPQSHSIVTRTECIQWTRAGQWFAANTRPESSVAADAIGALGYFSGRRIIDMQGVIDPHIARLDMPSMGRGMPGHEKRDFAHVLSKRPDYIFREVTPACRDGKAISYPDGSTYIERCVAIGRGPKAGSFGEVQELDLFLSFEERLPAPAAASP
jgi:hypothetical protein